MRKATKASVPKRQEVFGHALIDPLKEQHRTAQSVRTRALQVDSRNVCLT